MITQFKEKDSIFCFAEGGKVDKAKGIISDVSVMSTGEAKGHGILIDEKTLEQLSELLVGQSLPAYVTHEGAIWGDRVTQEAGLFYGFSYDKEAGKVKGSFKAFESFKKHEEKKFDTLFELAEELPENFGVSIVFNLGLEWELEDGSRIESFIEPDNAVNDMPFARPKKVFSVDFVDRPAANEGLFRENDNQSNDKTMKDNKDEGQKPEEQEQMKAEETPKAFTQEQFDEKQAELSELQSKFEEKETEVKELSEKVKELEENAKEFKEAHDSMTEQKAELSSKLEEAEKELEFWQKNFAGVKPVEQPEQKELSKTKDELKAEAIEEFLKANPDDSRATAILRLGKSNPELFES